MGGNFKTRYCQAKSPVHSSLSPSLIHRHTYLGHRIPFEEKTTRDLVWQQTHQLTSPFPNPEKHHKGEPSAFSTTRSKSFPTKHTSRRARAIAENPHSQGLGQQRAGIGRIGGPDRERRDIPAPPIADAAPPVPPISRPPPGVRPLCERDRTTCDHVVAHQTTPPAGWDWTVAGGGWERSKPEGFLDAF